LPRHPRCDRNPAGILFRHLHDYRSASSSIRGRPTRWRNFDPSNLLAMSLRCRASSVSGFATVANSSKAFLRNWAHEDY
jgi:hypothetical protein